VPIEKPTIKAHTHNGEELMIQKKLSLMAIALFLTIAGAAVVLQRATAQDKVEYNQIYDCGNGKSKFKVLSCKGTGKLNRCEIFYINEYSPGGGFKDSINRGQIEDSINQGCKIKNRPAAKNETDETNESENKTPVSKTDKNQDKMSPKDKTDGSVACFASDSESDVKNANEKNFRGVLRRFWEKEPEASGPTVTLTFQKMTIGAPRRWRATFDDAYSQADPKKPIYPVRATFTTCTDYTDAITKRKMERIYDCYVHKTGGWQCSQTGASGPLAMKDEKEYIPKKRQ
jgi:hypothetical protein